MLRYLLERPGRLVTKEELLDGVWSGMAVGEDALTGCLRDLRRALGDDPRRPQYIETAHRRGYRFIAPLLGAGGGAGPAGAGHTVDGQAGGRGPVVVGREADLGRLHAWWGQACRGQRQVVFVTGEAGIGKTTLVEVFLAQVAATEELWLARGECLEYAGTGEAYLPVLAARSPGYFYQGELQRLKGELLLQSQGGASARRRAAGAMPHADEAEACFHQALAVARRLGAKSLELRAALSLSRLWQLQGKPHAARQLLAAIYGWFTEGFDTADVREARELLEELGGMP